MMLQAAGYMLGNFADSDGTQYEVVIRCPLEGGSTLSDIVCLNPVTHHTAIRVPGQATVLSSGHGGDVFDLTVMPLRLWVPTAAIWRRYHPARITSRLCDLAVVPPYQDNNVAPR